MWLSLFLQIPALIFVCSFIMSLALQVSQGVSCPPYCPLSSFLAHLASPLCVTFILYWHPILHNVPSSLLLSIPSGILTLLPSAPSLQEMQWTVRRMKLVFSVGSVLWVSASIAFLYLPPSVPWLVYIVAVFVGAANALILVRTSVGVTRPRVHLQVLHQLAARACDAFWCREECHAASFDLVSLLSASHFIPPIMLFILLHFILLPPPHMPNPPPSPTPPPR